MSFKKANKYLTGIPSDDGGIFGLGRVVDFSDFLTRIAILCAIFSAVAGTVWQSLHGATPDEAAYFGANMAAQFFFAWLIAQELDPDRKLGGIIGGGIALVMAFTQGVGNILVLLWLLFILRLLNRTSGSRHYMGDNVLLLFVAFWLGKDGLWLCPVCTGGAYIVESQLKNGYIRSMYLAAVAFAMAAMAQMNRDVVSLDMIYVYIMLVTFFLFLPAFSVAVVTKFKGEKDNRTIEPRRLQAAQGAYLLFTFAMAWFEGNAAALSLLTAWAAGMGVGLSLLSVVLQKALLKKGAEL